MFKFFRKYNKVILVVGGCVLMVAFLVPQAVEMFGPNPNKVAIGTAHGQKLTTGDQYNAGAEIQLLSRLRLGDGLVTDDGLTWLLIQRDAEELGLYASDREVELALQTFEIDDERLTQLAKDARTTTATLREIVRRWLIAEQYRQLVTGTAYRDPRGNSSSPAIERLQVFNFAFQNDPNIQQLASFPEEFRNQLFQNIAPFVAQRVTAVANGTHRLSVPMLQHYIQENYPTVEGRVVLVRPDTDAVDELTEEELTQVFEQYKDSLPGEGEPFPFGYRYPDRVKLEYLRIPERAVRDAVTVDYVEVLDAYQESRAFFADESGESPEMPTAEAVSLLSEELRGRNAQQLAGRIMAQVQGLLAEDVRGYAQDGGYVQLPDDFVPMPWSEVTEAVRAEHGVRIDVMGDPEAWVAVDELRGLEGIGFAVIGDGAGVPFESYVGYTRQLEDEDQPGPRSLRSQIDVASKPLRDQEGNLYVFRLIDAEASHVPAGLDEVRDRVVADAKAIAAYHQLVAEADSWETMAINEGLDAVAEAAGSGVSQTFPFQKVSGNEGDPPNVLGVGTSRAFVDAAFALVDSIDASADVETLSIEQRLAVTPLPEAEGGPALSLFMLDGFEPLTRRGYEQAVAGGATFTANATLNRDLTESPMSIEAIARRVGFDLEAQEN
ncbi:MAG: hypothetical protein AAF333_08245 [Planctomycetota bacterium]